MSFRITSVSTNVARNICRSANKSSGLKNHVVSISELNRSKLGFLSYQRRFIDSNSWASEALEKNGVKVPKGPDMPEVHVTEELLQTCPPHVTKVIDEMLKFNLVEMNQFVRAMQKKLGMSDADLMGYGGGGGGGGGNGGGGGGGGGAAAAPAAAEPAKVKEHFDVKIGAVDAAAKIKVIKEVRAITGLGLKEAKEMVEKAPVVVKAGIKKEEAEALMKTLADAGAKVELV